jgi:hypothetical protein
MSAAPSALIETRESTRNYALEGQYIRNYRGFGQTDGKSPRRQAKMKLVSVGYTARQIPRPAEVRRIFGMTAVE